MSEGWVKNYRKLEEWEWYTTPHMAHLFQHLIRRANHKDKKWRGITVERGQFITSREKLSQDTGITNKTIRTCLERLKRTNDISVKGSKLYSVITITNYDSYQGEELTAGQGKKKAAGQRGANGGPRPGQRGATTKNDKNEENEKKLIKLPPHLDTEIGRNAVEIWLNYKKEQFNFRYKDVPIFCKGLGRKFKTVPDLVAGVQSSKDNGYSGLFADRNGGSSRAGSKYQSDFARGQEILQQQLAEELGLNDEGPDDSIIDVTEQSIPKLPFG